MYLVGTKNVQFVIEICVFGVSTTHFKLMNRDEMFNAGSYNFISISRHDLFGDNVNTIQLNRRH